MDWIKLQLLLTYIVCSSFAVRTTSKSRCLMLRGASCSGDVEGLYPSCDSCSSYVQCKNGILMGYQCQKGQEWDNSDQQCVHGKSKTCLVVHPSDIASRQVITGAVVGAIGSALVLVISLGVVFHIMWSIERSQSYTSPLTRLQQAMWYHRSPPPLYDEAMQTSLPYDEMIALQERELNGDCVEDSDTEMFDGTADTQNEQISDVELLDIRTENGVSNCTSYYTNVTDTRLVSNLDSLDSGDTLVHDQCTVLSDNTQISGCNSVPETTICEQSTNLMHL